MAAAVRAGVPAVNRGGLRAGGQALSAAVPLFVDGNRLGAGVMQTGVYLITYENPRTQAAAHALMAGQS